MVKDLGRIVVPSLEEITAMNRVNVENRNIVANENTKQNIDASLISNNFNKYIVSPLNAFGLGGFVFDNEDESKINLSADITDHYSESNVAIQDHIAVKPKKVTLRNFVGELVHRRDNTTNTTVQQVVRKLTILDSFLPQLSDAASQARDLFLTENSELDAGELSFDSAVRGATDLYSLVQNLSPPTKRQQQAYMFFKALMEQKIIVSVQTPFEFMNNMAIESIEAIQPPDTQDISEFAITLKEIRFVDVENTTFDSEKYQSRTGSQREDLEDQGNISGTDQSILDGILFGDPSTDELFPNGFGEVLKRD